MRPAAPLAAFAASVLLAGCAAAPPEAESPPPMTAEETAALLDAAIAGEHRSDASRARDAWRHPRETLLFFGLRADMAVMEIWPGAGGWYMEILAPVLGDAEFARLSALGVVRDAAGQ